MEERRAHRDITWQKIVSSGAQPFHIAAVAEIRLFRPLSPPLGVRNLTTLAPSL